MISLVRLPRLSSAVVCLLGIVLCLPSVACKKSSDDSADSPLQARSKAESLSVVTFTRGKYSGGFSLAGDQSDQPLDLTDVDVRKILSRCDQASSMSSEQARDWMAEARALDDAAMVKIAESLLGHPDEDVRAEAVLLLDGMDSAAAADLLVKVMDDKSPDIRQLAMEGAKLLRGDKAEALVVKGLGDESLGVRQVSLHLAMEQEASFQGQVLAQASNSPHVDLALASLAELEARPSKQSVVPVIQALGHAADDVRETAQEMLSLHFGVPLSTREEAALWWEQNQHHFDDDLSMVNPQAIEAGAAQLLEEFKNRKP